MKKKKKATVKSSRKKPNRKTAILYTRFEVGQTDDSRNSCSGQEKILREYCKKKKIEVIRVYSEFAQGRDFERPEFQKVLSEIKSGKLKSDYFLFTTWDRFSRNIGNGLSMVGHLNAFGIELIAIQEITF